MPRDTKRFFDLVKFPTFFSFLRIKKNGKK
nr:MAG TPA: hypothetical protein [Microviridae sp.]